jgi:hypothetical protein
VQCASKRRPRAPGPLQPKAGAVRWPHGQVRGAWARETAAQLLPLLCNHRTRLRRFSSGVRSISLLAAGSRTMLETTSGTVMDSAGPGTPVSIAANAHSREKVARRGVPGHKHVQTHAQVLPPPPTPHDQALQRQEWDHAFPSHPPQTNATVHHAQSTTEPPHRGSQKPTCNLQAHPGLHAPPPPATARGTRTK